MLRVRLTRRMIMMMSMVSCSHETKSKDDWERGKLAPFRLASPGFESGMYVHTKYLDIDIYV
jgi:hypothetical protein